MIRKKAKAILDLSLSIDSAPVDFSIRVDSYALSMVFLFIMDRIAAKNSPKTIRCKMDREDNFITFDLAWSGRPVTVETLRDWNGRRLEINGEGLPFTLREIIKYHGAKVGVSSNLSEDNKSSLRLFFPLYNDYQVDRRRSVPILSQSRPEFFDFDLFGQVDPNFGLAQRPLSELNYTVFDTETTGLDPGAGDEIIAIGALRIVNGRLLRDESMEQLIDPHRTIPVSSTRFHGIRQDMIKDRPGIDEVLPRFHRFVADTVLIGHNVAFDMRMLQEKEAATGIRFTNPVLDTLLLSAAIHPAQSEHAMEAIAERLGVSVEGRHTAIGDAVVTGKIFLKMLPLLAKKGILTLDDAMTASKKTFFARVKY
jgi:DNA polymerase III subunit epsilon